MSDSNQTPTQVIYQETVWPSLMAALPIGLIAPAIALVVTPFTDFVVATLAGSLVFVICLIALLALSPKIRVSKNATQVLLHVNAATIDREHIGVVTLVEKQDVRAERGPLLDARSFRVFQPSVAQMLKLSVIDEADETPYWLISSRNPKALIAALKK